MSDLINRKDTLQARPEFLNCNLDKTYSYNLGWNNAIHEWFKNIEQLPSVDRPIGKWIDLRHDNCYKCSACGDYWMGIGGYNFCPNCGADMRGEDNE